MKERILHILCRLIFIVAACPIDASALSSTDDTICNEYNEKSGIATETERDRLGRVTSQITRHNRRHLTEKEYIWGLNDQLLAITNNGKQTLFEYDGWGNLAKATYPDGKVEHRNPDRIGNLYASADKKDRKYGAGGRLEEDAEHFYHYDDEGNLIYKELRQFQEGVVNYNRKEEEQELGIRFKSTGTGWRYDWQSNGMLARVIRPDEQAVHFRYDALGRRTRKMFRGTVTRWIWDGNVPLHEWEYKAKGLQQPPLAGDTKKPVEPADDVTTWVFEEGTFVPTAKLKGDKRYSIVTDYLGTPIQMYDEQGEKTWDCTLDVYGKVANFEGSSLRECPFRYQGQYEDEETGLYYNRFRYYEPETGGYISQDPIKLFGGKQLYNYVYDVNSCIDALGLKERVWDTQNMDFDTWFDQASISDIEASMADVTSIDGLRNGGGKHELFPVALAPKAKELGFSADELKKMSVETNRITFENVIDRKTGEILPAGMHHKSKASSHFHSSLMEDLASANTKTEAKKIIAQHHKKHMKLDH